MRPGCQLVLGAQLFLSQTNPGSFGAAAAVTALHFMLSPQLEKRVSHPLAFSPSSPYEHSKCSRTDTLLCKERLLS